MAQKHYNQKVNKQWSWYHIRRLETLANIGDLESSQELKTYHNRLVRESNFRLMQLSKAGVTRYAYEKAQAFLKNAYGNVTRYKLADRIDNETMRRQILSMQRFLSYETSTPEGVRQVELKRIEAARNKWFDDIPDISDKEIEGFLRMLGDESIRRTLLEESMDSPDKLKMSSGDIVDLIRGKFEEDSKEKIIEAFTKYRETVETQSLNVTTSDPFYYDDLINYLKGENKN